MLLLLSALLATEALAQRPNNFYLQGGQTSASGADELKNNFDGSFFFGFGSHFRVKSFFSLGFAIESSMFTAKNAYDYAMARLDTSKLKYVNVAGGDTYSSLAALALKFTAFNQKRIRPYLVLQPGLAVVSVSGFDGTNPQNNSKDLVLDSQNETLFGFAGALGVEGLITEDFGVFLQYKINNFATTQTFKDGMNYSNISFGVQLWFGPK